MVFWHNLQYQAESFSIMCFMQCKADRVYDCLLILHLYTLVGHVRKERNRELCSV